MKMLSLILLSASIYAYTMEPPKNYLIVYSQKLYVGTEDWNKMIEANCQSDTPLNLDPYVKFDEVGPYIKTRSIKISKTLKSTDCTVQEYLDRKKQYKKTKVQPLISCAPGYIERPMSPINMNLLFAMASAPSLPPPPARKPISSSRY